VFYDVWGPSPILSTNGARYYVIFVDHFSKFTWFYPITCKYDVSSIFPKFQAYVECLFDRKIKSIQTDGGGEFQKLHHLFASMASIIGLRAHILTNKMGLWNVNTDILSRWASHSWPIAQFHLLIGPRLFKQHVISLISSLCPSLKILLLFKNYLTFGPTTTLCECSVVLVGLISGPITCINLIFAPTLASLSAIVPLIVATNASTHQLDAFISLAMLFLMNCHFPSRPSPLPHTRLLLLHTPSFIHPSFHTLPSPRVTHALQIVATPPPCPSARLPLPLLQILLTLLLLICRFCPINRMPHRCCSFST
jgi:hypothetical protein